MPPELGSPATAVYQCHVDRFSHLRRIKLRLAVFTNRFPARLNTFFSRDMRALLDAGVELDIFAFYPLEPMLWDCIPDILDESVLPRSKIHHISFAHSLRSVRPWPMGKFGRFLRDTTAVSASAIRFGIAPLAKSAYVCLKAWAWAQVNLGNYDHILAYWGNYAATCAYIMHRLGGRSIPFSMFLHAGIDLYRNQVYLRQKLLYADNIIVVCKFNRQFIHDRYSDIFHLISTKIHEYQTGLDFGEFVYEPENRPPRKVLAVGNLEKQKGFDYLLHATYELKGRGIDIEVEVIGDGTLANSWHALANKLRITDRVKFRGWLPSFEEVRTAMKQATILVHPSSGLGDATPTVIKEAMALGTPVIASNIVGIPELLDEGRCGILTPPDDAKALANAIERLLTNDALRRSYAAAARRYVEEKLALWRNGQRLADILCSTTRLQQAG
jgi:glycosyltransferase involved in cell wall biosynthesis